MTRTTAMYERYFGLSAKPFTITPDPSYLYLGERHREALAHLVYGVRERLGFVQLTGEVGTGKTLLTRALLQRLPAEVDIALIYRPEGTVAEFLAAILRELQVAMPARRHSVKELVEALNDHLLKTHAQGRTTVLLVDEAQTLRPQLVEQIRLLTNLETAHEKLLHIVLVAQPELRDLLRRPELRQVSQRINARYHLQPLARSETAAYVAHRLAVAGAGRALFTRGAIFWLHRLSGGVPRLINLLADRALLGTYANGGAQASASEVMRAAREVGLRRHRRWGHRGAVLAGVAGLALAASLALPLWPQAEGDAGTADLATAPATPPAGQRLERRLAAADGAGLRSAFDRLFRLWGAGAAAASREQPPCLAAKDAGLRCYYGHGVWAELARLDRPAIVELSDAGGRRHRAVLSGAPGNSLLLHLGSGAPLEVSPEAFARYWTGDYLLLWEPLALQPMPAGAGDRGASVVWLRERLAPGSATAESDPELFDPELAERLRAFQRTAGLAPTGQLDERTLLALQTPLDPQRPRLAQSAAPRIATGRY